MKSSFWMMEAQTFLVEQFAAENPNVKGIRFMKNFGKSQALHAGFAKAREVIITMDADLQDSPEEIPGLYNMITSQNFDLVSGWKKSATIQWLLKPTFKIIQLGG
jgi:glycosyltransferase involved in cell wall biosynthesis